LERIKARLHQLECDIFDLWSASHFREVIQKASEIENHREGVSAFARLAQEIGAVNQNGIVGADSLLAVLDGTEVDSETAAEVGLPPA
jgi:nucleoside 2-deoxyribosyltransferase